MTTIQTATLTIDVLGTPVPQGSIRSLGKGRPSVHSNADRLLPWRDRIQNELIDAGQLTWGAALPLTDPMTVECVFTMQKPKSAPKTRRTYPTSRPDSDKLVRAVLDAIQNAGIVKDDSQVVDLHARKVFPLEDPDALATPGVRIAITTIGDLGQLPRAIRPVVDVTLPEPFEAPW